MDLCVFDWKLFIPIITACIASGTAIYIASRWKNQKRSEIIVDEAEHLLTDILEVKNIMVYFGRVTQESNWIDVQGEISKLDDLIDTISMRNEFFRIALGSERKIKAVTKFEDRISLIYENTLKDYANTAIEECETNANYLIVSYFHNNQKEVFNDLFKSSLKEISHLIAHRF